MPALPPTCAPRTLCSPLARCKHVRQRLFGPAALLVLATCVAALAPQRAAHKRVCVYRSLAPHCSGSAASARPSAPKLAKSLLRECDKPERSLAIIDELATKIESEPLPQKPKRTLLGDWKLVFASDAGAAEPFTTGDGGNGPFSILECALLRLQESNVGRLIEVTRRIGPFGNEKRCLLGKWSLADGKLRVRYTSLMMGPKDGEPPRRHAGVVHEARISHASSRLLLLRSDDDLTGAPGPLVVFSRLKDGVDPLLLELRVDAEDRQ